MGLSKWNVLYTDGQYQAIQLYMSNRLLVVKVLSRTQVEALVECDQYTDAIKCITSIKSGVL